MPTYFDLLPKLRVSKLDDDLKSGSYKIEKKNNIMVMIHINLN